MQPSPFTSACVTYRGCDIEDQKQQNDKKYAKEKEDAERAIRAIDKQLNKNQNVKEEQKIDQEWKLKQETNHLENIEL